MATSQSCTFYYYYYYYFFFSLGEQSVKNNREWFYFRFYGYSILATVRSLFRLGSHGTGLIFDRFKIRTLKRFAYMEPRQLHESLDGSQPTQIAVKFLADALEDLTGVE